MFNLGYEYEAGFNAGYNKAKEELQKENTELEQENAALKRDKEDLIFIRNQKAKYMCEDKERLHAAKELIQNIIRVTWGEGWNYSLDVKVKAEQFLNLVPAVLRAAMPQFWVQEQPISAAVTALPVPSRISFSVFTQAVPWPMPGFRCSIRNMRPSRLMWRCIPTMPPCWWIPTIL